MDESGMNTQTITLLTTPQAAERLALSERMIAKLVKAGQLPAVKIGRAVRFRASDLERFIESRMTGAKLA